METEEILEIFDGERRPRGYAKARSEKLGPDEYKVAVGIWVVDANGRLLITRRSLDKLYAPGKWENTGGHMRAGEAPVAAVIRELSEETGLNARPEDVRYLGTLDELDGMMRAGEMAGSTCSHMAYYREAFEAAVRARA